MAKRQLRSELTSPSAASSKRPRANQYHDTSIARPKARRTDSCGPHISDFVPPNTSAELAIVRVTTKTAQAPANDTNNVAIRSVPKDYDPSAPGSYTGPSSGETLAVTPMPMNGTQPTPGPHMVSSTAENNSVTSRPFLTDGISTTTRPYVTHHDTTTVVRADQTTTSNTQPISQALSHHTTTSERQNLTITHEDDGSATRNVKKRTEGRGSNTSRSTHTESSKSFDQNLQRSAPTPLTNPSIDRLRWMPTPFTLIELSHGEQWLPRVQVSPDSELSKILDIGQHPVASAIAKIHRYGHSNSIPQETRQVLRMFDDIARSDYNEPHITFLDPLLYSSLAYTRAQCEDFRKKEWAWLVRAGRPITFPGEPSESWDLVTIQPIYESLEICLVVSRDNRQEIYTVDCSRPPPPGLESIQLYESPTNASSSPIPFLSASALQDIAFYYYHISDYLKPDTFCAVMRYKYRIALAPQHLHEIAYATLFRVQPLDCTNFLVWAQKLNEFHAMQIRLGFWDLTIRANRPRCTDSSLEPSILRL